MAVQGESVSRSQYTHTHHLSLPSSYTLTQTEKQDQDPTRVALVCVDLPTRLDALRPFRSLFPSPPPRPLCSNHGRTQRQVQQHGQWTT